MMAQTFGVALHAKLKHGPIWKLLVARGWSVKDLAIEAGDRRAEMLWRLGVLSPRNAGIMKDRFGLDGHDEHTTEETAQRWGLCSQTIRLVERRSLEKMARLGPYKTRSAEARERRLVKADALAAFGEWCRQHPGTNRE